jgi:hypothetical protein
MTKYIQFDSKGRQTAITDLDGECPEGYRPLNVDSVDGKLFYLVNDLIQSMPLTKENMESLWSDHWDADAISTFREERNSKLFLSDWTQMDSSPLSAEKKAEWASYRQALRDMTDTITSFREPFEWPTPPAN